MYNAHLMNIHEALVHLRRKTGMTQREVSRRAEMASGSLSRIEQGNGLPSIPSLLRLLEVLGADLLDLAVAMKFAGRQPETRAHLMDEWQIPEEGSEAISDELRRD
ncbi:MAG: helix-turn-helix transcriptional regulator, partial [Acidobacteriota bacterium]